jgi:hypothetical protein
LTGFGPEWKFRNPGRIPRGGIMICFDEAGGLGKRKIAMIEDRIASKEG